MADIDLTELQKKHGANITLDRGFIPARCQALNLIVSGGRGLPRRQIIEFFGQEGCGKTTVIFELCSIAVNHMDCIVLFANQETDIDDERFLKFGLIKGQNFIYFHEDCVERVFMKADTLIKEIRDKGINLPIIVVVDSVNGTPPYAHLDIEDYLKDHKLGAMAKAWGDMSRQWISKYFFDDVTLLLTNHLTEKINTGGYGGRKTQTPGGRVLKYLQTIRIELIRVGMIKGADNRPIGIELKVKAAKNKFSPPFQECRIPLFFGNPTLPPEKDFCGTWDDIACLWFLKDYGVIKTAGGWSKLELCDTTTGEVHELKFQGDGGWINKVMIPHRQIVYEAMRQALFSEGAFKPKGAQ